MNETKQFWFPAKRYGWGWGAPSTWQGWVVLILFAAIMIAGAFLFPPAKEALGFAIYTIVASVVLVAVLYLKGEPTKWRWGDK